MSYAFKTKSQTLIDLMSIDNINVLPIYVVNSDELDLNSITEENKRLLNKIIYKLGNSTDYIVRSSCKKEDQGYESNAGKFKSILNVRPRIKELFEAICEVYRSYGVTDNEEILIQPMLKEVLKSGVVFTRDLYTAAPYYCINYWEGKDTAAITSGGDNDGIQKVIYRNSNITIDDPDIVNLLGAVKIVEQHFKNDFLDIEFGINLEHDVYIFQVRPIAVNNKEVMDTNKIEHPLLSIKKKIDKLMRPRPFIAGHTSYFGVMPDWNPAEIIGIKPKRLAISLYKELITDNIWAYQRENYGYKSVKNNPLMVMFCGVPYIDTRITFNSFIPEDLSDELTEKLVDYYLSCLKSNPSDHDKIEFNIVFSCYYVGINDEIKKLGKKGFSEEEIEKIVTALRTLTNKIINPNDGYYKRDLLKIKELVEKHDTIMQSDMSTIDKIYWLIEVCKENGTLPFAGIARTAFVAVQMLKSMVRKALLSNDEYDRFMTSLNTISKQMSRDKRILPKEEFLEKYGHIRPGTYDIESPRYDDAYELYFSEKKCIKNEKCEEEKNIEVFSLENESFKAIDYALKAEGLDITARDFFEFAKVAIEGREYSKYIFTKTVSEIIRQIEIYGKRLKISRSDLAHLDIYQIKNLYSNLYCGDVGRVFKRNIEENKYQFEVTKQIKLPILILSSNDIYVYSTMCEEPNYITTNCIMADIVCEDTMHNVDLSGKIICIRSADPGYDYLFTKGIAGLITQFGGANSHMAIRCAELQIPAVIGSGEKNYNEWVTAKRLFIDGRNKQVKIIS